MHRHSIPLVLCSIAIWLTAAGCDGGGGSNADDLGRRGEAGPDTGSDLGPIDAAYDGPSLDGATPDGAQESGPDRGVPSDSGADQGARDAGPDAAPPSDPIQLNELMSKNEGAAVDEVGETDDWIELHNHAAVAIDLDGYRIGDDLARGGHPLPQARIEPGGVLLLWADGAVAQGPLHLPFRLSSAGETVYLWSPAGELIDEVELPALSPNETMARRPDGRGPFQPCGWATPGQPNGEGCGPPPPPEIPQRAIFDPYEWNDPWPFPPTPLVLSELALRPAAFVEVLNSSDQAVDLTGYRLAISAHAPGLPLPDRDAGTRLRWPTPRLEAGERLVVPVAAADVAALDPDTFEGVVSLWSDERQFPVDRIDFMRWPEGAALTRQPDDAGRHRFCAALTPGAANQPCRPLQSRPVGDRLRHLRTPGDFAALASGGVRTGIEGVKVVVDMDAGDVVHLLGTERWDLHYTFVREVIDGQPHLDRCDRAQAAAFNEGWYRFSEVEYFEVAGRRYLLATLNEYSGPGLATLEYTPGDRISPAQIRRGFFTTMAHVLQPARWSLRPQNGSQILKMREIEGLAPIVGPNAPFRGVTFQPLTEGVAFGTLRFVPVQELGTATLGQQVIVVSDQVPNDIAFVGGLITEAFQTPLAHVNLLSRNRGTPNMSLVGARDDPRLGPLFDQLVRLEVAAGGFEVRPAEPEEAETFWASQAHMGPPLEPRWDLEVRGVQPLSAVSLADLPSVGAKAAQLGELMRVDVQAMACAGPIATPSQGFAIPLVHSLEHYVASGARARLDELEADPRFRTEIATRAAGLEEVRALILAHPVQPALLAEVTGAIEARWGQRRLRFRSSSNTEDLPGFNGAGLYTSASAELGDPRRSVEDAMRIVWASLWRPRAYDERAFFNVAGDRVAMGILVHPAFLSEQANGVAISRNVLDPLRRDHYINVQIGEASVTNPAPGVTSDQLIYQRRGYGEPIRYLARSSLSPNPVLSEEEVALISCTLGAIHNHFWPRIDPELTDRWFAMDIEFKLMGPDRQLVVKQARPYAFGDAEPSADCREF